MKQIFLFASSLLLLFSSTYAAPGDTTWVQAHDRRLDNGNGYGAYDTAVVFPTVNKTYRKVFMVFNLGEYPCPAGTQYCHQWDYTVTHLLMTPTDTFEIARMITPYATSGSPRFPSTWNKDYVFDVTDYATYMKGNAVMRLFYSGYSAGFTANIKFAFIEGTPERDVKGIDSFWRTSKNYGDAANPIDNFITAKSLTAPAGTQAAEMKVTITGHGADNNYCCEFDVHSYHVKLNSTEIDQFSIWKNDCGFNQLSPQGGTWIYDRANWCPGESVRIISHKLTGITAGNNYTTDIDFDPYTAGNTSYGSYTVNGVVVNYGGFNHTKDASLDDIISPTIADDHFRDNPFCGNPVIKIANNGSAAITSMKIKYGADGSTTIFNWTGNMAPLTSQQISLPEPWVLRTLSGNIATKTFTAEILEVNGATDEDATNNKLESQFVASPSWPVKIAIKFLTNKTTENSWKIYDLNGNVVAQRNGTSIQTTYNDTVTLGPSCYKLVVEDAGCDGLSWWANSGQGAGSMQIRSATGGPALKLTNYFSGDFGCGFTQYFTTNWPTSVQSVNGQEVGMEVAPNPAQNNIHITFNGLTKVTGTLRIIDQMGRKVYEQNCTKQQESINTSSLANGTYFVVYNGANEAQLKTTLVIAR